uniref:Uncharacterized protein n=1 Tax=Eptatretus burgeri TaxID=7764 RepID=A0A8C4WR88_EPTBU
MPHAFVLSLFLLCSSYWCLMQNLVFYYFFEEGSDDATNDVDASQSKGHPLYHRIDIKDDDGQNITWMPQDDLNNAVDMLLKALHLRLKHMQASQQRFPQTTSRCLRKVMVLEEMKAEQQPVFSEYPADLKTAFDQDVTNVPSLNYSVGMRNGVLQMFKVGMEKLPEVPEVKPTLLNAYLKDMAFLLMIIQNGPVKTYCSRRLKILSAKFELHQLTNHLAEMVELKVDGKQDFQSVCKVDTHVHAAAAMTQNELLNIMCKTYEQDGDVKGVAANYKQMAGNCFTELRISVRGTSPDEWSRLADWFVEQEVYSPHIRWVVQLPRHL